MLLIARRNLFSERTRLAISVGGVALSVFLIGILLSLYRGWSQQVGGFVERVPADLWVASEGTTDFIYAASILPANLQTQLLSHSEVKTVSPLIVRPLRMSISEGDPERAFDVQVVGYDPKIGLGGPLPATEGKSPPGPGEIVVDEEMSRRQGIKIGDRLVRGNKSVTVVGMSSGGDYVFTQVAFVTLDTAIDLLDLQPRSQRTFFALKLRDSSQRDAVLRGISLGAPGIRAITPEDLAAETRNRVMGNILPILIVLLIVAFLAGLATAGLTIYTATVEKSREYGILKAEGFTAVFLYRLVFEQSIVTGILGFLVGAGLTLLVAPFAQNTVPQFVVFVRWQDMLGIAGATLLMCLVAAFIPMRRLASIDPVTVFKS